MKQTITSLLSAIFVASISTQEASAAIIIRDTFARTGPLDGSFADTGQQWNSDGWSTISGGTRGNGELQVNGRHIARLGGLSLQPNTVYRLEIDLTVTAGGSAWIGFGFTTPANVDINTGIAGSMLHRENPEVQTFSDSFSSRQTSAVSSGFPKILSIDLATGNTLANSELSWRVNGVEIGTRQTVDASTVNGVFITNSGITAQGLINELSLTTNPIPEPTCLILLGMGIPFLSRRRRELPKG